MKNTEKCRVKEVKIQLINKQSKEQKNGQTYKQTDIQHKRITDQARFLDVSVRSKFKMVLGLHHKLNVNMIRNYTK